MEPQVVTATPGGNVDNKVGIKATLDFHCKLSFAKLAILVCLSTHSYCQQEINVWKPRLRLNISVSVCGVPDLYHNVKYWCWCFSGNAMPWCSHIEALTHSGRIKKWPTICRRHFRVHLHERKCLYFDLNFNDIFCKDSIDDKSGWFKQWFDAVCATIHSLNQWWLSSRRCC